MKWVFEIGDHVFYNGVRSIHVPISFEGIKIITEIVHNGELDLYSFNEKGYRYLTCDLKLATKDQELHYKITGVLSATI